MSSDLKHPWAHPFLVSLYPCLLPVESCRGADTAFFPQDARWIKRGRASVWGYQTIIFLKAPIAAYQEVSTSLCVCANYLCSLRGNKAALELTSMSDSAFTWLMMKILEFLGGHCELHFCMYLILYRCSCLLPSFVESCSLMTLQHIVQTQLDLHYSELPSLGCACWTLSAGLTS